DERRSNVRIREADGIERDVEAACLVDHGLKMMVHGPFVESINFCDVGGIAGGEDLLADDFYGCPVAPGEKKRRPLARKRARHGAADSTSRSVNHRNLVLQQHLKVPFSVCDADTTTPEKWAHQRPDSKPRRPSEATYS